MMNVSTLAPSEKHLEDWIAEYPSRFGYVREDGEWVPLISRFVARQAPLPSGIVDFLAVNYIQTDLCAVELKKGELDSRALAQVLRYMSNLDSFISDALYRTKRGKETYTEAERREFTLRTMVGGILVGHSMTDINLLRACRSANVTVAKYDYSGDGYTFTPVNDYDQGDDTTPYFFNQNPLFRNAVFDFLDHSVARMRRYHES